MRTKQEKTIDNWRTFRWMRSTCVFCCVISLPISMAMLRRFPIIPATSCMFWSISSSRASFVILKIFKKYLNDCINLLYASKKQNAKEWKVNLCRKSNKDKEERSLDPPSLKQDYWQYVPSTNSTQRQEWMNDMRMMFHSSERVI